MTEREEFCAYCGKRRPMYKLLPLIADYEEMRQYHCDRSLPCVIRMIVKTRGRIFAHLNRLDH
jgi:hypothetical protein